MSNIKMRDVEINGMRVDLPAMPDFTPDGEPNCGKDFPTGLVCTREPHANQLHVAGNGDVVVGIWIDPSMGEDQP